MRPDHPRNLALSAPGINRTSAFVTLLTIISFSAALAFSGFEASAKAFTASPQSAYTSDISASSSIALKFDRSIFSSLLTTQSPILRGAQIDRFRMSDLDLRDPHVVTDVPIVGCLDVTDAQIAGPSINTQIQTEIQADSDDDDFLDASYVLEFEPFDTTGATMPIRFGMADCTEPIATTLCGPFVGQAVESVATASSTGLCIEPAAGTLRPYSPAVVSAAAPCFGANLGDVNLILLDMPLTLRDTSIGATFTGTPPETLTNGLLRGFLTEADANSITLPNDLPIIGGKVLSSVLPGGASNCASHSDKDLHNDTPGWWLYFNFPASRIETPAPEVMISGDPLNFGNQNVGTTSASQSVTVTNTGTADLVLATPTFAFGTEFALVSNPNGTTIPPGETGTVSVTFLPTSNGSKNDTLTINSNASGPAPTVALSGTGVQPEINVQGNGETIFDGDVSPDPADHTNVGDVVFGTGSVTRTFTIQNLGAGNLNLTDPSDLITISGPFAQYFTVSEAPSPTIAPGSSTTFDITYTPQVFGTHDATISFGNNDSDENPFNFWIRGTGVNFRFRTAGPGPADWHSTSTWEESLDGGSTWGVATTTPTAANSDSIVIMPGHEVFLAGSVTIDQTRISAGTPGDVSRLTLNNGSSLTIEGFDGITTEANTEFIVSGNITNNSQMMMIGGELAIYDVDAVLTGNSVVYNLPTARLRYLQFEAGEMTSDFEFASVDEGGPRHVYLSDGSALTLHEPRTITGSLVLEGGTFTIGNDLTMGFGSTVRRAGESSVLNGTPNFQSNINLEYAASLTTGTEMPVSADILQDLTIEGTSNVTLASDATVRDTLTLGDGTVTTGANTLSLVLGATVNRNTGYVIGNFRKAFYQLAPSVEFEVGSANGYSPVNVTYAISTPGLYEQTVKATQGAHPNMGDQTKALSRYWTMSNVTGPAPVTVDVTFDYLQADVPGTATESSFVIQKYDGGIFTQPGGSVNTTDNTATITGVTSFSDWTLAEMSALASAPSVMTNAASNITGTTATLNGSANPNGSATTGWFRWSYGDPGACDDTFGNRAPSAGGSDLGSGTSDVPFSEGLTGLMPDATVYYCAIAQNSAGTSFGAVLSFTPQQPNQPPVAVDDNVVATEDTQLNFPAATLLANDSDPDNDLLDIILPSPTTSQGGTVILSVPGPLGIVTYTPPNNFTGTDTFTYIVTDGDLFDTGQVTVQVNPNIPLPTVVTAAASSVTGQTATLNGSANPNGSATTGWFRYSLSDPITCNDTFGTRTPETGGSDLGSGTSAVPFSQGLTGLMPDATIYYCAIAQNAGGISFGSVLSFTPQWVPPTVATNAASSVGSTSATLNGSADPNGSETIGYFRFATEDPVTCNDAFGTQEGGSNLAGDGDVPFSEAIEGLSPGTTYFFCAIASNSGGTAFGPVLEFTTSQLNVGISVTPTTLNFGDQTLGTTGPDHGITIVSTGTDPLVLGNLILIGDTADFQFVQVPAAGQILQPGEFVTAEFAFAPTALGLRSATLTIESNASGSPIVELIGGGVVPDINVAPVSVDFGSVSTALGGVGQQIQISNLGTGDLVIAGAAFTGPNAADFSSSQVTELIVIPSGQTYPIAIIFNPQGIGPRSASLDLGSNDPDEPLVSIPLSGIGVNPGFLQFSAASYSGNEGDGTIALTIQRVNGSQGAVSAFFGATGGLATGGEACGGGVDYVNNIPFANFADGDTEPKIVLITVCDDAFVENSETFDIRLFTSDADIGANTQAIVSIADNDVASQISISGTITNADDSGLSGHSVGLTGSATGSVLTDGSGLFTFSDVTSGSFIVTPADDPSYLFDPISRNYPNRTTNVTDANFRAYAPGTEPRTLTIRNGFATPGQQALVPIVLESQGNETGLTFSLAYDQALLSGATVECGTDAGAGCSLTVNTATPGMIGISVDPTAAAFTAGTREVVRVLFFTSPSASVQNTPVAFANSPAVPEVSDADANPLLTRYIDGSVVFIQGIESDVAARPNGDGVVTSVDVAQVRRFAVGLDTYSTETNEFQRADSSPYATAGDGIVAATDITQARRYQIGLDPTQPAGGPSIGSSLTAVTSDPGASLFAGQATRGVRVVDASAGRGSQVTVALQVDAEGDENVYGFSLNYNQAILSNPLITIGSEAVGGNVLSNTTQPGRIGISVDFGSGAMPAGTAKQLVTIRFDVSPTAPFGQTPLEFGDTPAFRETSNSAAQALETIYTNGFVTILAPTAAGASISGRVMTTSGRAISGAVVTVLDINGVSRTFTTGTYGYFSFEGLAAGRTYVVTVAARRYRFADPNRVVDLSDSVTGLDFIGTQ